MLSAEERRRLDQIERLLELHDPDFVARMRTGPRPRHRRTRVLVYGPLWLAVIAVWVFAGWLVAVPVAVLAALVMAVGGLRGPARGPTPPPPPFYPA